MAYKLRVSDSQATLETNDEYNMRLQEINNTTLAPYPSEGALYGIENLRKRGVEEGQETA